MIAPELATCEASILDDLRRVANERRILGRWTAELLCRWLSLVAELRGVRSEIRAGVRACGVVR